MPWLAVALGGALGAMSRYAIAQCFPFELGKFPIATFTVNIMGSFLMGILFVVIVEKSLLPDLARHTLMVGFLGAFTTFSTFSHEGVQLMMNGYWKLAIVYALSSGLSCFIAAYAGYKLVNIIA